MFSAKIFVNIYLTRIVKCKSRVVKSNPDNIVNIKILTFFIGSLQQFFK